MQDLMRTMMRCLLVALLFMAISVSAYDNQQSWLDGSLDADAAMELLERDTDQPFVGLVETNAKAADQEEEPIQQQQQQEDVDYNQAEEHAPEGEALVETEAEAEAGAEAVAEAEGEAEAETETEAEAEKDTPAEAQAPAPVAEAQASSAPIEASSIDLDAAMPMLMELHAASRAQAAAQAGWVGRPPRRRSHRRSIRAEREALAQKQREDAIYAENLRKLAVRREKWSVPHHITSAVHQAQAKQLLQHGAKKDDDGFMTKEEAQVESLLQLSAKPMVTLHHTNNVHGKLNPDLLHGTGLFNKANRAATVAGLAASKDNHPEAPAFIQLPPLEGQQEHHSPEFSFVAQKETTRPTYAGPKLADLPQANIKAPTVLRSAPKPAKAASALQPAHSVSEAEFVAGLPAEFMELDAATQVKILALVDAGVDVDAESESKQTVENKAVQAAKTQTKAKTEAKAEAKVEQKKPAVKAGASKTDVAESELADAASALKVLAELQKESHVPFAKLVHLLAKGKQQ